MINNKKNIVLIKKIILLLIFIFFSNLFYLYFKNNYKESFVIAGESDPTNTFEFLTYKPPTATTTSSKYLTLASTEDKIDNLTTGALYALGKIKNDGGKNFSNDMGDVKKFPINDIVKNKKNNSKMTIDSLKSVVSSASRLSTASDAAFAIDSGKGSSSVGAAAAAAAAAAAGDNGANAASVATAATNAIAEYSASAPENLYDENDLKSLVFGYGIIDTNVFPYKVGDVMPSNLRDIRIDTEPNFYLDNYDQIDKIIEREKLDNNYVEKTLKGYTNTDPNQPADKKEVYEMRNQDDESKVNRRGAVEVAYSRKEELNETKNKHKLTNTRYNSINLQYIFLIGIIVISIIVLGLYYVSLISNLMLIIYIILVIFVIYFFNIINIVF